MTTPTETPGIRMVLCFGTGEECWCCGGYTKAADGPFEGDNRYCSEECFADWDARLRTEEQQRKKVFACCKECGFDNAEHDTTCGLKDEPWTESHD